MEADVCLGSVSNGAPFGWLQGNQKDTSQFCFWVERGLPNIETHPCMSIQVLILFEGTLVGAALRKTNRKTTFLRGPAVVAHTRRIHGQSLLFAMTLDFDEQSPFDSDNVAHIPNVILFTQLTVINNRCLYNARLAQTL